MRSLSLSPTKHELEIYFKQKGMFMSERSLIFIKILLIGDRFDSLRNLEKLISALIAPYWSSLFSLLFVEGGKLTFADFLDVMHTHSGKEKLPDEIIRAFRANDYNRTGMLHIRFCLNSGSNWIGQMIGFQWKHSMWQIDKF